MKFINTRLLVNDFPAALSFWRDIMKLPLTYDFAEMGYAYFDAGKSGIELLSRSEFAAALGDAVPALPPGGQQMVMVFQVDDIDSAYKELVERGATSIATPQDRPAWRVRSAHISDPDGNIIELYSPLPEATTPTPES